MKDKELFSSKIEAFSDDLKINLSKEEFNREVVAARKRAPSNILVNFNLNELNTSGSSTGLSGLSVIIVSSPLAFKFLS